MELGGEQSRTSEAREVSFLSVGGRARVFVVVAIALSGTFFWFGRVTSADSTASAPASSAEPPATTSKDQATTRTPAPTTTSTSPPTVVGNELATLLGPGDFVLADVTFEVGPRAVVVCDVGNADDTPYDQLVFVQLAPTDALDNRTVQYRETITWPTHLDDCGACRIGTDSDIDPSGEPVAYGHCADGGSNGATTAFAVAAPRYESESALALKLSCGGTILSKADDGLLLSSHAWKAGSGEPTFRYPPIVLSRIDAAFEPDDRELLRVYCDFEGSAQLDMSDNETYPGDQGYRLSYDLVSTEIGDIGVHGPLLLALDEDTCEALASAYWDNAWLDDPADGVLAAVVDLPPPGELLDWYFTCQVE